MDRCNCERFQFFAGKSMPRFWCLARPTIGVNNQVPSVHHVSRGWRHFTAVSCVDMGLPITRRSVLSPFFASKSFTDRYAYNFRSCVPRTCACPVVGPLTTWGQFSGESRMGSTCSNFEICHVEQLRVLWVLPLSNRRSLRARIVTTTEPRPKNRAPGAPAAGS